jgi:hypothetical protein
MSEGIQFKKIGATRSFLLASPIVFAIEWAFVARIEIKESGESHDLEAGRLRHSALGDGCFFDPPSQRRRA